MDSFTVENIENTTRRQRIKELEVNQNRPGGGVSAFGASRFFLKELIL